MLEALRKTFRPEQWEHVLPVEDATTSSVEQRNEVSGDSKRKPNRSMTNNMNDLLGVLKTTEGQSVTYEQLAEVLGYKSTSGISRFLNELLRLKAITRKGDRGTYTYKVNRLKIQRRRRMRTVEARAAQPVQQARKVEKPNYVADKTPDTVELTEGQKTFMRFIGNHQGVPISQTEIAHLMRLTPGGVYHLVDALCKKKLIERSLPTRNGTVYRVVSKSTDTEAKRSPNPLVAKPIDNDSATTIAKNETELYDVIESLSWEYMKIHWNSNMLQFLTWLKQQKFKR